MDSDFGGDDSQGFTKEDFRGRAEKGQSQIDAAELGLSVDLDGAFDFDWLL